MNRKLVKTILLSAVAMATSYLISFILTPYITETVGAEAYGFVQLSRNFITYAGIITIALNSYATRFIAVAYHQNDLKASNGYFSSVLYANAVLAAILFVFFCIVGLFADFWFNISPELVGQVKILFVITGITFSITTVFSVFACGAYIENQLDKTNIFKCISYVAEAIALYLLYKALPTKIWYVAIGSALAALIIGLSNILIQKKYTPSIRYSRSSVSMKPIRELVGNGIWNSLNSLGNTLNSGLDLIVTNLLLTPLAMGQVAIAKTISAMFYALFQMVAQPFQPIFLRNYSENNRVELLKNFKLAMVVSGLFSNLAFAGFFALGKEYYSLWIPKQDIELVWALTVLTILGSVIEGAVFPLYYIYTLTVKNKIPCIVTISGGLLNVIGMYVLIKTTSLGPFAIVLTTTVIMTAINLIFNPIYMTKCLKLKPLEFYPSLVKHIASCTAMTIAFWGISQITSSVTWIDLIIKMLLCVAVGSGLHLLISGVSPMKLLKVLRNRSNG